MLLAFTRSNEGMNRKPKGAEVAKWQKPSNYIQERCNVVHIAASVANGCCWRAGIYPQGFSSFKKANAQGSQIIALDFDACSHEPHEVIEYANSIGLPANIVYATFSQDVGSWLQWLEHEEKAKHAVFVADYKYILDTKLQNKVAEGNLLDEKKAQKLPFEPCDYKYIYSSKGETAKNEAKKAGYNFRIMWCIDSAVSVKEYEQLQVALMHIFAKFNPDESTKDVSRLWFGSALPVVLDSEEPLSANDMKAVCGQYAISRKMKEGKRIRTAVKGQKEFIPEYAELPEQEIVTVGGNWYERLRAVCPLWDKYEDGEYMSYNERLTLFSNLKYLRRSDRNESITKDILRFYKPEVWQGHTFDEEQIRTMLTSASLNAVPIVYSKGERMTVPEYLAKEEVAIIPKTKSSYVSIEELDAWLDEKIPAMLQQPGLQYLSSQTGSGKTKRIIDFLGKYLAGFNKKVIYACPHFAGAHEFYERFTATGFGYNVKVLPEQQLTAKDKLLLQLGLPKQTRCSERAEFIDEMMNSNNGLYIITHALLVNMPSINADLIIVDENIESSLIRTSELSYQQLYGLLAFIDSDTKREYMQWLEEMETKPRGSKLDLSFMREKVAPQLREHLEDFLNMDYAQSSLIPSGFFNCEENDGVASRKSGEAVVRITQRSPLITNALCNNTPIKLFSATPISARIKNYYGFDVEVIEAPTAKNNGKIIQYTALSGAKGKKDAENVFTNLPKLAGYVRKSLGQETIKNSLVISFKGTSDFWESEGFRVAEAENKQTHFKNNCGLDCFKGKNLIVIGKYDLNPDYYLGVWDDIGDGSEPQLQNHAIELNGVKQNLYLWDKEELRAEQLQNLTEASEQTAGRARALRESGATVYLFSNFVINGVDEVF